MLRHLLLALFLIGLSLPAMAVSAHAGSAPVDCHGMQPTHKPDADNGKIGHFCIGCVASPALPFAVQAATRPSGLTVIVTLLTPSFFSLKAALG